MEHSGRRSSSTRVGSDARTGSSPTGIGHAGFRLKYLADSTRSALCAACRSGIVGSACSPAARADSFHVRDAEASSLCLLHPPDPVTKSCSNYLTRKFREGEPRPIRPRPPQRSWPEPRRAGRTQMHFSGGEHKGGRRPSLGNASSSTRSLAGVSRTAPSASSKRASKTMAGSFPTHPSFIAPGSSPMTALLSAVLPELSVRRAFAPKPARSISTAALCPPLQANINAVHPPILLIASGSAPASSKGRTTSW